MVLPGVGASAACADAPCGEWLDTAARGAIEAGTPFLGVCVGFQLLYERSDESPGARGLGVLRGGSIDCPRG